MSNKGGRIGKRKRKIKKIKVFLLVSCVLLSVLVFLASPFFNITEIMISGSTIYPESKLRHEMGLDFGSGGSIFYKTCASMEKGLEALPYISDARVEKVFPRTLLVEVTERQVRGYVRDDRIGVYLYIDEEGFVLDIRQEKGDSLPVITGLKLNGYSIGEKLTAENPDAFADMIRLASIFKKYDITDVNTVDVSDSSDIRIYIRNAEVVIGTIEDADVKINWARSCLQTLDPNIRGTLLDVANKEQTYFKFPE